MKKEKRQGRKAQAKIDRMLEIQPKLKLKQFTRDGALEAIAQFVVCDDQVWKINVILIESLTIATGSHHSRKTCIS